MHRSLLKITTLSFMLLSNIISLGMEIINTPMFYTQGLPEDIRRHIFVVACPSIQNQLKNCSSWWHEVGAKKAPNMYRLLDDTSFRASHDDWRYIMMHAALDKNVEVMCKVLDRTDQRNFDYDFEHDLDYIGSSFRLRDAYDFDMLLNSDSATVMSEKFKELELSSPGKNGPCFEKLLFRACFAGGIDTVTQEAEQIKRKNCYQNKVYDCIVICLYNNNPHCIKLLYPLIRHIVMDDVHMDLLDLAMRKNKKHAFRALVQYDVFGRLNEPIHMYGHGGRNTTTLDLLYEKTDISNIAEYIELCKELGCKTWQEVECEEEESEQSLFSACAFVSTFCSVQ